MTDREAAQILRLLAACSPAEDAGVLEALERGAAALCRPGLRPGGSYSAGERPGWCEHFAGRALPDRRLLCLACGSIVAVGGGGDGK